MRLCDGRSSTPMETGQSGRRARQRDPQTGGQRAESVSGGAGDIDMAGLASRLHSLEHRRARGLRNR